MDGWMDARGHAESLVFPAMEGLRGLYSTRLYAGDAEQCCKPVSWAILWCRMVTEAAPDLCCRL